jgi:tetratricopeptide (TPR) repeat protein
VTARQQARAWAAIGIAISGLTVPASAQRTLGPSPNAPKLMVGICRNPDKKLGPDAAEQIRDKITGDISPRDLYVFPAKDITSTLASSGYSDTDALSKADASALTKIIHADMDIECTVTKTATGFQIEAWMTLQRDQNLEQPLGTYENTKLDGAAAGVSREFKNAFKTFDYDKTCRLKAREGKTAEALKAASDGIAAYPKSIWLRVCQMQIAVEQKKPPADIITIAEEIRKIDPKSQIALKELYKQYDLAKNQDKKIEVLMELYNADPTNPVLLRGVANDLAAAGKFAQAEPIIAKAVAENQGDVTLVQTYFNILGALKNTKMMAQVGESMIKMDTSLADADFYDRMVSAYVADSNYQKAAEWAARATAKFPNVAENWLRLGNLQRRTGQTQQSVVSLKRALSIDPKAKNARLLIVSSLVDMNQYDSSLVAMRDAYKAGEDPNLLGDYALTIGNKLYKVASAAEPKTIPELQKALPYLSFADSVSKTPATKQNAELLIGVSSFYMGALQVNEARESRSCEGSRRAQQTLLDAQTMVQAGGRINPPAAAQILGQLNNYLPAVDAQVKQLCKTETAPPAKRPGTAKNKNP